MPACAGIVPIHSILSFRSKGPRCYTVNGFVRMEHPYSTRDNGRSRTIVRTHSTRPTSHARRSPQISGAQSPESRIQSRAHRHPLGLTQSKCSIKSSSVQSLDVANPQVPQPTNDGGRSENQASVPVCQSANLPIYSITFNLCRVRARLNRKCAGVHTDFLDDRMEIYAILPPPL